ncbi:MAG: hypothetical protein LBI44_05755 [Oscillospiraceae bacterium]|jgi:predicted HicB family RNase H-like nuclease|nr:hypothetical protein [Oscillospiraceae bacterium]
MPKKDSAAARGKPQNPETPLPKRKNAARIQFNVRLREEHKEHLDRMAWSEGISTTKYVEQLIEADIAKRK